MGQRRLHGDHALDQVLLVVLEADVEGGRLARCGHVARHLERHRRLALALGAADQHQLAGTQAATDRLVHRHEAGRDRDEVVDSAGWRRARSGWSGRRAPSAAPGCRRRRRASISDRSSSWVGRSARRSSGDRLHVLRLVHCSSRGRCLRATRQRVYGPPPTAPMTRLGYSRREAHTRIEAAALGLRAPGASNGASARHVASEVPSIRVIGHGSRLDVAAEARRSAGLGNRVSGSLRPAGRGPGRRRLAPPSSASGSTSASRPRLDRRGDPLRRRTTGARRHDALEERLELLGLDRLLLDEQAGQPIEHGAVRRQRLLGAVEGVVDDLADLGVDLRRDLVASSCAAR